MDEVISNRYKLIKLLGRGSFGSVYLAEDMNALRESVIKLSRGTLEQGDHGIFEREARVSASLHHPNIASVLDFGITPEHRSYIVREYVKGESLEEILKEKGKLSLRLAVDTATAIATGLEEAHSNGIIHRDLKPSNIVIPSVYGSLRYDRATILDFGVFGQLINRGGEATTQAGELYGTPKYMAPEQLRAEEQTSATDVYGLGMVLFEMLYGHLPFPDGSLASMMSAKIRGNLNFPEDSSVPNSLVQLLKQCLTVDQESRIQSARQLISKLIEISRSLEPKANSTDSDRQGTRIEDYEWFPPEPSQTYSSQPAVVLNARPQDASWLPARSAASPLRFIIYGAAALFSFPVLGTVIWLLWNSGFLNWGTILGVLLVLLGIGARATLGKFVKNKQTEIGQDAQDLLFGSKSRDLMTESLAIQVNALISRISREDDKVLGMSLALMVSEFQESKEAPHRQNALMNVVLLLEKISVRLSPWYVRHDKLVATVVALIGILSGITTITVAVINTVQVK